MGQLNGARARLRPIISVTINPNGLSTGYYAQWGLTAAYGQTGPVSPIPIPSGATNVSAWMTSLSPSTTYHYQVVATNSAGTGNSGDMTLTTSGGPPPPPLEAPLVVTGLPLVVTATNATIAGTVDPQGNQTTVSFQWGLTTAYGNTTPPRFLSGDDAIQVSVTLQGLNPGTTYHYQLVATNTAGGAAGSDVPFATHSVISIGGHNFTYAIINGTITITGYAGPGGAVIIPSTITGLPVTAIGEIVFSQKTNVTSISFPDTLTRIGGWAFENCTGLTEITLPNSIVNLGFAAFAGCSSVENVTLSQNLVSLSGAFSGCSKLSGIAIPNSVLWIDSQTFDRCTSLTNVTIGTGAVYIGERAFGSCSNLTSVMIPASTTNIDFYAFSGSTLLAEINVSTLNSAYSSADGVLFDKSQTTLILYPEGKFVPNYVVPNGVTNIGPRAFFLRANLTGITLPETLTSWGDWAFAGCGLTRLAFPNSVTNIPDASHISIGGPFGDFSWCYSLTNVIFGRDLAYLGTGAFTFCTSLTAVFFQGNAPATVGTNGGPIPGPWIFLNAPLVTVYYLPGTTGWEPTFSQRPTKLWNPEAQTSDASFGVQQGHFGFSITGTVDIPIVVEVSTNPSGDSWAPLQSCTITNGSIYFSDLQSSNRPSGFYRIRSP